MTKPFRLPLYKRILQKPWFQAIATWLVASLLRVVMLTYRLRQEVNPNAQPWLDGEKHGIFCFWHGRMILLPFFKPKGRGMHVLISHHRDGELIARVIRWLGVDAIRGSGSRGVRNALAQLQESLEAGDNISITPDGPRGPLQKASRGAAHLAHRTGLPVIPVSFSASRRKHLKSWDRFMIPMPFAHVLIKVGEPFYIEDDVTHGRNRLEQALNTLTQEADMQCQH